MVILRMLREQEFLVPDMLAMKYEKEVKDDCKIFGCLLLESQYSRDKCWVKRKSCFLQEEGSLGRP